MARRQPVQTPAGQIELLLPDDRRMAALGALWRGPVGVLGDKEDVNNEHAKVVFGFEEGERVVRGSYMFMRPALPREGERTAAVNRRIVARALARLAVQGVSDGLILLCATLRTDGGEAIPGIGIFIGPGPGDAATPAANDKERNIDRAMGRGYGRVLGRAVAAIGDAAAPDRLAEVDGLGTASSPLMGTRFLDFLLVGGVPYCLQETIDDADPAWEAFARAGIRQVVHAPVGADKFPYELPPDDTAIDPEGSRRIYRILCRVAHADGDVHATERELLERYRARLSIGPEEGAALEREGVAGERLHIGQGALERELMLAAVLEVVSADGTIADGEVKQVVDLGRALRLPRAMIDEAIAQRRAALTEKSEEGPSENGLRRIYHGLCRLAACDGVISSTERARLESFRIRHGIAEEEANHIEQEAMGEDELRVGKHPAERWLLMDELVALAAADGELAPDEEDRVLAFATVLGIEPGEVLSRLDQAVAGQKSATAPSRSTIAAEEAELNDPKIVALKAELSALDEKHGEHTELHLVVLIQLGILQEMAGNPMAALYCQERLVETGGRLNVEKGDLGQGWRRLAGLYQAIGRDNDAARAEAKARTLLEGSGSGAV